MCTLYIMYVRKYLYMVYIYYIYIYIYIYISIVDNRNTREHKRKIHHSIQHTRTHSSLSTSPHASILDIHWCLTRDSTRVRYIDSKFSSSFCSLPAVLDFPLLTLRTCLKSYYYYYYYYFYLFPKQTVICWSRYDRFGNLRK